MAETIRLAIVSEPSTGMINDLLTTELSHNANLQILERAQIDKVLREQTLAVAGSDHQNFLKVGQIVGADGVIALETRTSGTNSALRARLIAVKPGVILGSLSAPWPLKDPLEWIKVVGGKFAPLWPKLTVLPKDAVPISVLNLRSASSSPESNTTDQELTLLLLDRLMLEKEIFVLERRKLGSLVEEKTHQGNEDSAFWNGSFLLDGTIDKDGSTPNRITIDARVAPHGGATPLAIAVTGARNEPVKLVDELAKKILASLQKKTSVSEWKPEEEAAQFYNEAEWALKWGMFHEAQSAADSAWALGQRDLPCADVRVRSYVYDARQTKPRLPFPTPDLEKLDISLHALELYYDFTRTLPSDQPEMFSPWYFTSVEAVDVASSVLQQFYFDPTAREAAAPKLAQLRSIIRDTVARLNQTPSIHDAYWRGGRWSNVVDRTRVPGITSENQDRQWSKVNRGGAMTLSQLEWGCFWQETPEDCIALYREMLTSDVFAKLSRSLWFRRPHCPRLTAWKKEDEKRIPDLWRQFVSELKTSTNLVHQIEANALLMTDARNEKDLETAFNDLFAVVFTHTNEIARHNLDLFYDWTLQELMFPPRINGSETPPGYPHEAYKPLREKFLSDYRKRLSDINTARIEYLLGFKPSLEAIRGVDYNTRRQVRPVAFLEKVPITNTLTIASFAKISTEQLAQYVNDVEVVEHKFRNGKLWFDLQFHTERPFKGEYSHAVFAVLDNAGTWQIINRPVRGGNILPTGRYDIAAQGPHFEVFHNSIYCSDRNQSLRFDLNTKQWEKLTLPGQVIQFFVIEGQLYATTEESIVELTDDGHGMRILASIRRRPTATSLDSLDTLSTWMWVSGTVLRAHESRAYHNNPPMLFPGPNHSLRANIEKGIYSFDGKNWTETWKMPIIGEPETHDPTVTLIRALGRSNAQVWLLPNDQTNAELYMDQTNAIGPLTKPFIPEKETTPTEFPHPFWSQGNDFPLMTKCFTLNSNLCFLIDCSRVKTNAASVKEIDSSVPQMRLACFDRELSNPLIIPIQFDPHSGPTPSDHANAPDVPDADAPWILFADGKMYVGSKYTRGVWIAHEQELIDLLNRAKQAARLNKISKNN